MTRHQGNQSTQNYTIVTFSTVFLTLVGGRQSGHYGTIYLKLILLYGISDVLLFNAFTALSAGIQPAARDVLLPAPALVAIVTNNVSYTAADRPE